MIFSTDDIGLPLGNRTVHFVANNVPLHFAGTTKDGQSKCTVYFWDDPSRCWIWTHEHFDKYPIPREHLLRIVADVLRSGICVEPAFALPSRSVCPRPQTHVNLDRSNQ